MKIKVETYIGYEDDADSERVIDHDDPLHRNWLNKHIFWAVRNNRAVQISPIEGDEE